MASDTIVAILLAGIIGLVVGFSVGMAIGTSDNPTKEEIEILNEYGFRVGEGELRARLKAAAK